jgi:hypothetical protein
VNSFLGYSSRVYRSRAGREVPYKLIASLPSAPDRPRGALIAAIEDNAWLVTLFGVARHYPPTGNAEFLEWTRDLRTPLIYDVLKDAEPISPAYSYRRTENCFRHFERMPRWPERFVVLGDAAVSLNPVYGQGMTVGAQNAVELGRWLGERRVRHSPRALRGLAPAFQKRLAKFMFGPWMLATGEDFKWPGTEGRRPNAVMQLIQRYADQVLFVAGDDQHACQVFLEVQHGLRPAEALLQPRIAAKVLQRVLSA